MARKAARKTARRSAPARKSARPAAARTSRPRNIAGSGKPARERAIEAFLAMLAEKPIEEITLREVASTAGVSLRELRAEFNGPLAILAAHMKATDDAVLAGGDADMAEEPPRDRLFEILMRRFEALAPHKEAWRSLARSAARHPGLALAINGLALRSHQWMLAAADIGTAGPKGFLRVQGLALLYATVARTWLDDDDDGLAPTMAALDRALTSAERWSGFLDDLCRIPEAACAATAQWRARTRRGGRRRRQDQAEAA